MDIKMLKLLYQIPIKHIIIFSYELFQVIKNFNHALFLLWLKYFTQRVLNDIAFCAFKCTFETNINLFEFSLYQLLSQCLKVLETYFCFFFIIDSKSECFFSLHDINLLFNQLSLFGLYP